ncbi:protein saal1 [Calliphora vicina]|uniref:protein saal1 n=1 Tax=Calliphora vicina TaxID=7373 RepID=UPI00325BBF2E
MSTTSNENNKYSETNSIAQNNPNADDSNSTEPASYNPTLAENECEENDLERLKGDAIGDTLYSERFVLNTLLRLGQLSKDLQEEEDVERDLCSLWDMTLEEDVVKYLLNHDVLELFANIIKSTEDKRLTEILVGIIGNMCNVQQTRNLLTEKKEVINILLDLSACMDSLTLEQLMRLLAVVFVKMSEDQIEKWYNLILKSDKFVENLCFILNNAANNSLILQTMESLNAILAKFFVLKLSLATENGKRLNEISKTSFEELFVQPEMIECTIEAFKTLVKESNEKKDSYEAAEIPESIHKAKQTFCNIHSILTQYQQLSRDAYASSNDEILKCFKDILQPMAEDDSITTWQQYEQDVLETINDILRVLPRPLDLDIVRYLLKLLYHVDKEQEKQLQKSATANDFESDDDDDTEIDHQISYTIILNTLYYLVLKADKEILKQYVSTCPRMYTVKLLESFEQPLETEYMKNCYQKLKEALD